MIEAVARASRISGSPRKGRLVLDLIRGKSAGEAIAILQNTNRAAAAIVEQVLRSAIANAQVRALEDATRLDEERLVVTAAFADQGPSRVIGRPGRRSRMRRITRRTTHYTIWVAAREED